jgi:hypothetical protein
VSQNSHSEVALLSGRCKTHKPNRTSTAAELFAAGCADLASTAAGSVAASAWEGSATCAYERCTSGVCECAFDAL